MRSSTAIVPEAWRELTWNERTNRCWFAWVMIDSALREASGRSLWRKRGGRNTRDAEANL
jgi:hypothetical protein